MKKLMTLFVALSIVSVAAFSVVAAEKGPAEIKLKASMGDINFTHAAHQEIVPDCATCHHTGVEAGACNSCHDAKPEAPKSKKVFHKLCKDCHKMNKPAPTKCKGCHVK